MKHLYSTDGSSTEMAEHFRRARYMRSAAAYDLYARLASQVRGLFDRADSHEGSLTAAHQPSVQWNGKAGA